MFTLAFRAASRALIIAVAMGMGGANAQTANWPNKSIRLIVGAAAGGPTDVVARIIANELSAALGQSVVVDNRPGAGHQIGMTAMANAEPDGYTFGIVTTPFVVNPAVYSKMPYETKALMPVSLICSSPLVLVVHPSVNASTPGELVALAKARPGELNMASAGNITGPHLAGELFRSMAGIKVQHVAYRGGPQATTATIRGEAHFYFDTPSGVRPHIESGAVKALAHTFPTRIPQMPALPTIAEAGFPGYEFHVWTGVVAPAAVPKDILVRFEVALREAAGREAVRMRLDAAGFIAMGTSAADFGALIDKELAKWQRVVKDAGITAQ
jgi:tripartite-type tricarboxylate transporter receptor subunit TctC